MNARIVLVGPVLPFRGGISQYNTSLFREMRRSGYCHTGFSFSRQYPKWLYPGQSDLDPSNLNQKEDGVIYSIDSMKPWTWWRTTRLIVDGKPDLAVFHWWTIFWLPCFVTMFWLLKREGIRVAFICHNLEDHGATGLKAWASRVMLSRADAYLVHSSEHAKALGLSQPTKPLARHPIPVYGHYPPAKGTLPKRGRLELLFFGFIRAYKGLDILIEALNRLGDNEVFLTVVGEPWGNPAELVAKAAGDHNIELHLAYTSDGDVSEYFDRADIVVLPYRSATGSAVAAVAQHFETAMIASAVGGLPDVVIEGKTGVLVPAEDVAALATEIGLMTRERAADLSIGVRDFKQHWNWQSLARELALLATAPANAPPID